MSEAMSPGARYTLPDASRPLTRALLAANRMICRAYHEGVSITPCTIPASGPAIVVCNHISALDPAIVQVASPRLIVWMMAAEYLDVPGMGWFFRTLGVIGVARGQRDTTSTRAALRVLAEGGVLGIFPEGRIATTRKLLPFQPGAATLAARNGTPVVPVGLDGSTRGTGMLHAVLTPQRVEVRFGQPLIVLRRADPTATTVAIRDSVAFLAGLTARTNPRENLC